MMKKNLFAVLSSVLLLASGASCRKGMDAITDTTPETVAVQAPGVDRSNMFGLQEQPQVVQGLQGMSDPSVTPVEVSNICGVLRARSFRLVLNFSWILEYNSSGQLVFKQANLQKFKDYVALLRQNGVRNIVLTNTAYMYPYAMPRSHWRSVPAPGTEAYVRVMETLEKCNRMTAQAFPDISYFEVGNELNAPRGINLNKEGFLATATAEQNAPYIFTTAEQAKITADICYYSSKGLRSVNPLAKVIAPAPYLIDSAAASYLNSMYTQIKSSAMPTCRINSLTGLREIPASTNPGNYFEYLNWHPYTHAEYTQEWLNQNKALYQVAINHGDNGRKIIITEFGYFDSYLERREILIGNATVPAIQVLADNFPTLEALFTFRMFNWTLPISGVAASEQTYGIYDSPEQSRSMRPKPVALSLFRYYNGANADTTPLYRYMK